jgi:hypothetical protein
MTALWPSDKTIVTRLRVKCAGVDALAAQLRVASLLNAANLHSAGIPPAAIVCIHRLRDPLPGLLQLRDGGMRPQHKWEQAVIAALERMVQQAARPALGIVPANAEAVIFSDRAELLACLASDWCAGTAITRWWWQSLFRGVDVAQAVLTAWREAPEYVPAALQHLAENGKTFPFIHTLSDRDARGLLQSLVHRFALPELRRALEIVSDNDRAATISDTIYDLGFTIYDSPRVGEVIQEKAVEPPPTTPQPGKLPFMGQTLPVAPWEPLVPESRSGALNVEQHCLLGIGLMLQRAPAVVRTPAFAQQVQEWRRVIIDENLMLTTTGQSHEAEEHPLRVAISPRALKPSPKDSAPLLQRLNTGEIEITPETKNARPASTPLLISRAARRDESPASERETENADRSAVTIDVAGPTRDEKIPATARLPGVPVETAYGGVFYFINLGLFLNLYADFTAPLQPGIALSIWDFVALLGEQFVGEKIKADPVWPLLARLAGRNEQEEPGQDFTPPDHWRLPPEWLAPFPEAGVWEWTVEDRRLRVKHPEKFLVLDLPLEAGDPLQQLQDEMQVYTDVVAFDLRSALFSNMSFWKNLFQHEQRAHFKEDSSEMTSNLEFAPLRRWLSWLMPYVRARLLRALGLPPTADLAKILCEHHARLFATATHLDIELSLADLPIAIRLSGLDRNPGWVPAAGRFVDFRFTIDDLRLTIGD